MIRKVDMTQIIDNYRRDGEPQTEYVKSKEPSIADNGFDELLNDKIEELRKEAKNER